MPAPPTFAPARATARLLAALALALAIASPLGAGCAARGDAVARQRQATHAAVAAAEAMGAGLGEAGQDALARARAQLALGEALYAHGSRTHGRRLLHRAETDAALALALAREAPARALAQDAIDQLHAFEAAHGPFVAPGAPKADPAEADEAAP